jgi:hypothetical protein
VKPYVPPKGVPNVETETDRKYNSLVHHLGEKAKSTIGVEILAENVWLIPLDRGLSLLALGISEAESSTPLEYSVHFLRDYEEGYSRTSSKSEKTKPD